MCSCSMGAEDLAELRALHDLASLSLRGCPSLAAAGVSSLAALTALRCRSTLLIRWPRSTHSPTLKVHASSDQHVLIVI